MGFDYRDAWIAVRSESVDDVMTALDSRSLRDCTWTDGTAQSLSTAARTMFISAPIDGEIWCAGQRFYDLTHDENATAHISDLALTLDASVRVPRQSEVERIAGRAPAGILARERWSAPSLEGSSLPEPAPNSPVTYALSTAPNAESAARGSTFARWGLEAFIVFRSLRSSSSATYDQGEQSVIPNAASEAALVIAVIVLFELAVFIANVIDKRQPADARTSFRIRATRVLVVTAGAGIAGSALYVNDAFLLMASCFVALGGVIAASYIPDALFGGTKPRYD